MTRLVLDLDGWHYRFRPMGRHERRARPISLIVEGAVWVIALWLLNRGA